MLTGLFLMESDDRQFAFSLLPAGMQKNWPMKLVGATVEFQFIQTLAAMAIFGAFHFVTFVRTIQTTLTHFTTELRYVRQFYLLSYGRSEFHNCFHL